MKKLILFSVIFFCILEINAQSCFFAKRFGGATNDDGFDIAVDDSGNVYTTGSFEGTVDFDPGVGTYNLTSSGLSDIFISKLNASGNFVWAKRIGGNSVYSDEGLSIAVDDSGNVYTTGIFGGTVDFDPGIGTYNLTGSPTGMFISKLNASGNFVWAKQISGTGAVWGRSIAVDASGNVYTTGDFGGTADFDPGTGYFNLTSNGLQDIFVSKLDSSGNFIFAKQIGGTNYDYGISIAVDGSENVYTTGNFIGTVDFDPSGAGTYNFTSFSIVEDVFISKLDASGNFVWAKQIGGTGSDLGQSIAVDASGNVYTTGNFGGTADFDPGVGIYNLTNTFGGYDIFISKLSSSGNFVWAKNIGGTADNNSAYSIAVDGSGNVYTTGYFKNLVDFDPGAGTYNLGSVGGYDIFISQLDPSGNFILAKQIGGTNDDNGCSIDVDGNGNIYITGYFWGTADFNPNASGIFNLSSAGGHDVFVCKFDFLSASISSHTNVLCNGGNSGSATVTPTNGNEPYNYFWSNSQITQTITGLIAGNYTVTATDANGCTSTTSVSVTQPIQSTPVIYQVGNVLYSSASSGNQWYNNTSGLIVGATDSIYNPLITDNYYVIVTDSIGCVSDTSNMIYVLVTGLLNTFSNNENIFIYPNPSNDNITIDFPAYSTETKTTIQLLDISGKLLNSMPIKENTSRLNISDLSSGIYIIKISDNKMVSVKRFVKE